MTLKVHNTLTRKREELAPREAGKVTIYVCGPTVYGDIHIGNARAFLVFDVIRRYLRWRGFEVRYVQNYTDIDDKIINRANEEGIPASDVAERYAAAFEEVMTRLGVEPPDTLVRATGHIADMQEMIAGLINKGVAYESEGNVWFAVDSFAGYGKLSGRNLDDLRAGERVEPDPSKRNPLDFSLWKAAKPGEPSWPSPWGEGRPGWHIECSAMSLKQLGMGFDIHGGGRDLVFPHHENEIAQSEAFTGEQPFVRYWLHNGMVNMDKEKMSKSLRNFILTKDLLDEYRPQVIRLLAIGSQYRSDVDFGEPQLEAAKASFERLEIFYMTALERAKEPPDAPSQEGVKYLDAFRDAMDDDFNTPAALGVIHDLIRRGNFGIEAAAADEVADLLSAFLQMTDVLGLRPEPPARDDEEIDELLRSRDEAREAKRFEESDRIRAELAARGIVLEDTPSGTRWRRR